MATGGRGQRKVAQVSPRIASLLERAQHQVGEDALFGFPFDLVGKLLVVPRRDGQVKVRRQHQRKFALAPVAGPPPLRRTSGKPLLDPQFPLGQVSHANGVAKALGYLLELEHLPRVRGDSPALWLLAWR